MTSHLIRFALTFVLILGSLTASAVKSEDRFSGFPVIGKARPGDRTQKVITSDGVAGLRRPKWTRAMGDLGGWPAMFRFKDAIHLVFPHVDGHRGKVLEGTGKLLHYASTDHGQTWVAQPTPPQAPEQGTPEYVVSGDKLFSYEFDVKRQTNVRVSNDGLTWTEMTPAYKPPFYFWGVMYDPQSKEFWAPPHAVPSVKADPGRRIDLIRSRDGLQWEFVSTVAPFNNASESVLHFEPDRTIVVLIRRKYGSTHSVAAAKPPYTEWKIEDHPGIIEGEHFFDIAGQIFLGSRANYAGTDAAVLESPHVFDKRRSYCQIYRYMPDRTLKPWAVVDSLGDCSYPFLVETPTEILCAYYSQHEDNVCKCFLCAFDKQEFLKLQ